MNRLYIEKNSKTVSTKKPIFIDNMDLSILHSSHYIWDWQWEQDTHTLCSNISPIHDVIILKCFKLWFSLGIHHDGDGNHCAPDKYIMAASSSGGPTAFQWSTCSATELHAVLRSQHRSFIFSTICFIVVFTKVLIKGIILHIILCLWDTVYKKIC